MKKAALWILTIVLAVLFVLAGFSKVSGPSARGWQQRFQNWGYPVELVWGVGTIEILAGAGLTVPKLRRGAVAILLVVMLGAIATHVFSGEYVRVIPPLVLSGLLLLTLKR